jgi:hypothetical protein
MPASASELLHGVHRATPEHRARREAFVEGAITAGWRVGTGNVKHFDRIPGLDVLAITWRTEP